ncbi:MAG TPA: outer membrane beta-barrel protein [Longimicrobium sp.]|nr:outer membrane beta-barrel protein [Longimicrobium sp.]
MTIKPRLVLAALAGVALWSGSLPAQQSDNTGLMVGVHVTGSSLGGTGAEAITETGGGMGFKLGFGFNDRLALYAAVDAVVMEFDADRAPSIDAEYDAATYDLGVRVSFSNDWRRLRPYLLAAVTGVLTTEETGDGEEGTETETWGDGLTIGGGVQFFAWRKLAVDVGYQATAGSFTERTVGGEDQAFSRGIALMQHRGQVGLTWHP